MRLSVRLALFFALFGALISGGIALRHVQVARQEAYASTERLAAVTLEAVRALVQAQARQGRFIELGRNFEDLVRQAGVASIVVLDRKGKRLVGRSDDPQLQRRETRPGRTFAEVDDGIYDAEAKVDLGPRGKGLVQVGFRTSWLERRLAKIDGEAFGIGIGGFLAASLFGWLVGLFAGERIERMIGRIEMLARHPGRFRPIPYDGLVGAEVQRLAEAFNRMGASLRDETERRQVLEAEKRELSAMLVHDLKTPLTVIRSGITLLSELAGGRSGKREHARTFELLEMSTARLQRMVEDVLQLAKLEETEQVRKELVELPSLARACAKDFGLIAADRKQSIQLKLSDGEIAPVLGDPTLLRRVLDNLVHNAVEHTPSGGTVTVGVSPQAGEVLVEVCDSGPGVPPEARADIFRKFFQKDVKRHVGNVGLGLALCERVVTRHGGVIGIGDAVPKGARFYFTLPAAQMPLHLS